MAVCTQRRECPQSVADSRRRIMNVLVRLTIVATVWVFVSFPSSASARDPKAFRRGTVHHKVACRDAPSLHYNVYVPRSLRKDTASPLLIVYSSEGNAPVECFRDAAEKVGWIVCGSVESSNGRSPPAARIYQALRDDLQLRYSIHRRRIYLAGLSGGSDKAFSLVRSFPEEIAGVIGIGGVPRNLPKISESHASFVGIAGTRDPAYCSTLLLMEQAVKQKVPYRFLEWNGAHWWPGPEVLRSACVWLDGQYLLGATKLTEAEKDARPKRLERRLKRIRRLARGNQALRLDALERYESLLAGVHRDRSARAEIDAAIEETLLKLKPEIAARDAFRLACVEYTRSSEPFDRKTLTALKARMDNVAAEHRQRVYGRRAATVAQTVQDGLIDGKPSVVRPGEGCIQAFPKIRRK